jgi:hypothetical protein
MKAALIALCALVAVGSFSYATSSATRPTNRSRADDTLEFRIA